MTVAATSLESELDYPFAEPPEAGTLTEVAPGVHWIRMPLPFALDHINLWALEDGDGWALVDTGIASNKTRGVWRTLFAGPLSGRPVRRLLITHCHPDHIGLAGWLGDETGAEVWATRGEWYLHKTLVHDAGDLSAPHAAEFYRMHGADEDLLDAFAERPQSYRHGVTEAPPSFRRIRAGDTVTIAGRDWQVLVGEGHSPEHACLYQPESGVLISGDQVLPRITSNISVWPAEPEADPLGDYLETNRQFLDLPPDVLVLPSHGLPFRGLHTRIAQVAAHHQERLEHLARALTASHTTMEALGAMFPRKLDPFQTMFAIGETVAHLNRLVRTGEVRRGRDAEGRFRFELA